MVRNVIIFYGEELLAPRPTPKLEDHPLSAVRDCLLNVFVATLHNWRPFLHPQPEDAPCHGDRDPLNTDAGLHRTGKMRVALLPYFVLSNACIGWIRTLFSYVRSQNCETRLLAWSCLSFCLSVCMEQLGSHRTDFHEILYLRMFRKSDSSNCTKM
jgi:hypothetical protein